MQTISPIDAERLRDFDSAETALRAARTKAGLALGALLMPAGAALDWIVYPDSAGTLFLVRCATTLLLIAGLVIVLAYDVTRHIRWISQLLVLAPAVAIAAMLHLTNSGASPYFVGLILLMVVVQLLGFNAKEAALYCGVTILLYFTAVVSNDGLEGLLSAQVFLAGFFLVSTAAVCVCVCHLNLWNRFADFQRQQSLDEKNHQLQELDRQRAEFLANISHELRTPLTLILGPLDDVLGRRAGMTEHIGQTLAVARKNAERLRVLVDDLLDMVRIDHTAFRLELEEIDLRELLSGVVAAVRPYAAERGIQLTAELDPAPLDVLADANRLERVFFNLLSNALKFSPPTSTVRVELREEAGQAVVCVADQGPGIPLADQPHIFQRFFQSNNTTVRPSQGLGLGLALSREIVRWHHGEIELESVPGHGTTFRVSLPTVADATPSKRSVEVAPREGDAPREGEAPAEPEPRSELSTPIGDDSPQPEVLVIDDEPDMRQFLVQSLSHDFHVAAASDGGEGLRMAATLRPRVILLDMMLPDIDGLQVARRIREQPELNDTKIIVITARPDETVKIEALRSGADDFLSKPFSITEVRARVSGLSKSSALQADLRREREELRRSLEKLKNTEMQLFQSEKMRALGSLAAGLLHEINNPVNYTLMAADALKKTVGDDLDAAEMLQDIRDGIERIGSIVSDLRAFAYPNRESQFSDFPFREVMEIALRFTAYECQDVEVTIRVEPDDDVVVHGSRNHISQILVNLILNAARAVKQREDVRPAIRIHARAEADRLTVSVEDNGIGIADEAVNRAFEPFYSTAEVGQGLGLGLSICHTLVSEHDGRLTLASRRNEGTTVTFDLPLCQPEGITHGYAS